MFTGLGLFLVGAACAALVGLLVRPRASAPAPTTPLPPVPRIAPTPGRLIAPIPAIPSELLRSWGKRHGFELLDLALAAGLDEYDLLATLEDTASLDRVSLALAAELNGHPGPYDCDPLLAPPPATTVIARALAQEPRQSGLSPRIRKRRTL
ncbi:hypothetical protein FB382_003706 [Nocardioides ginsengisegetis]|uniref:Uncharacterized protein n=1 Tax=Nocardioides ginsengisegetis TaxID=661491 RepID=A0A7W3J3C2_9ACTN|nr:hypothetical protein [Nocardioides ginsengisegetis]MBA8805415.1 hypothetical protein [Nocardioides ginsengisegetis]